MATIGSFGTFTTARLAIYVSQKGLSVTGNNIANINTIGYTRQRLDQVSFKTGMADRYQNPFDTHVGNGAIAQSVSQLRDPYLDIRYRAEHSSEGFYNGKLSGLDQIADILDEIGRGENDGDGLLYGQFSDFFDAVQHIQVGAGTQVNDTLASTSAEKLCQLFYNAANQLERLKTNTEVQLSQEIDDINSKLISIRGLNEAIQQAEIYGDAALELRDERNNMIDALSEKLKIEATYSMVDFGGKEVEKLTIRLGNANPDTDVNSDSSLLVDGNYCAQLTTPQVNEAFESAYQIFDKNSVAYERAVKELNAGREIKDPTDPTGAKTFTDRTELDDAIKKFFENDANDMRPYAFLDPNGEGTNDPRVAKQVFDENYSITLSDLRDQNNKAWISDPVVQDTYVKDTKDFPTRAKYEGTFGFSGVWKDGDKINITVNGGQDPFVVEIGKDLTADAANGDAKNVSNAIRKKMLESGAFSDYEISTQTTRKADGGFNVQLTVKAKEPGKKDNPAPPTFSITSTPTQNPKPKASVDNPTQATDKDNKPITGQYKAKVTTGDPNALFHDGDKITIGTDPNKVTLEVGKDISRNAANDPARLAEKLAKTIKIDGYKIFSTKEADGNAYLVFQGATDPAAQAPTLPTVATEAAPAVQFTNLTPPGDIINGKPGTFNLEPAPENKPNGDNTTSRVITSYYMDDNDKWHKVVKTTTTSDTTMLDDNDLFGKLQAVREQLTEEGEFASQADIDMDESASIKRGIPYYQEVLDLLARQFAKTMNEANTGFAVDEKGNYLTYDEVTETFVKLPDVAGAPLNKTTGLTDDQKKAVEEASLGNFIKANFAGFMKDADGMDTNVLVDKYGNPLTVGRTVLTRENVEIDGISLENLDFYDVNEDGKLVTSQGDEIDTTNPNDPDKEFPLVFADNAFGELPLVDDPDNLTPAEEEAIKKAQKEIAAKKAAAEADMNDQALDSYLSVNGGYKMGGNLFSNRADTDDDTGITAGNISVSHSWSHDDIHIVPTFIKLFGGEGSNTTQQDNALHMGNLLHRDLLYNPQDLMGDAVSKELFVGSFQELLEKMGTTLGNDQGLTKVALETHMGQALDIDTSRDSVSAVDLNDEAMNLMTYTHSLNAAYRLMTTVDEMIERLITGTGVTR